MVARQKREMRESQEAKARIEREARESKKRAEPEVIDLA